MTGRSRTWFVVERHDNQKPILTGPFRTEYDANAYVTGVLDQAQAWALEAQPVDDDDTRSQT